MTSVPKSYFHLSSTHTWGASRDLNQSQASLTNQSGEVLTSSKDEALINFVNCLPDNCVCQMCKEERIIHRSPKDFKLFNIGSKRRFQKSSQNMSEFTLNSTRSGHPVSYGSDLTFNNGYTEHVSNLQPVL